MKLEIGTEGIVIKKFFGSKEISYSEIEKIVLCGTTSIFHFKDGGQLKYEFDMSEWAETPVIFDMIRKYNIEYENEIEMREDPRPYLKDELEDKFKRAEVIAREVAEPLIAEKLGPEFGIYFEVREVGDAINLYFFLTKNGITLELPEEQKNEEDKDVPQSFDNLVLAYLIGWDSSINAGKYGITKELEDEAQCRKSMGLFLDQSFDLWKDEEL